MQENNFDKKLREQLERRKINPSVNSWDKLNAQLDEEETKSTKKYWWLGIAASFLAGILVTSLVFNDSKVGVTPKVVNGNSAEEMKGIKQNASEESKIIIEDRKEIESIQLTETKVQSEDHTVNHPQEKENKTFIAENVKSSPVKISKKNKELIQPKKEIFVANELQLAEDIEKTVPLEVEQKQLATEETQMLDKEVEQLLQQAQEKAKFRNFENPYNLVNAEDLLENIEVEDKQSFKEKVWIALENGFHQIKSTVIE